MGDLTKELMRRSHIAQAHSTTYHPQTNGLVERQNRTLVNMLRVYCSRFMTDWDKYLPQVVWAYNSTQHSTTGISPFMMLPGLGGMSALPPSLSQVPGKYLCFLVTRVNERNTIDPEHHVILALTRLMDFMVERGIMEVSRPVYDPNRGKLNPRDYKPSYTWSLQKRR